MASQNLRLDVVAGQTNCCELNQVGKHTWLGMQAGAFGWAVSEVTRQFGFATADYPAFLSESQRAILLRSVRGVTPSSAAASVLFP